MTPRPIRLMFLGNRRLAWETLKLLYAAPYHAAFNLRAVVADAAIRDHLIRLPPLGDTRFISSDARQSTQIAETIRAESVDVLLSIQYNWILPADVIDLVQAQAFNLHNARLPDYKGYNSITHAIANGDTTYASTIHWMTEEVDSGDIAYVAQTPIQPDDTAVSLYLRTVDAAMSAVASLLNDLAAGTPVPRKPMPTGAGVFHARHSVDVLANVTGKNDPAEIARIARAAYFPPFNAAFIEHAGRRYFVLPASETENVVLAGRPANALVG